MGTLGTKVPETPAEPTFVPNVPIVPGLPTLTQPAPDAWSAAIARLDAYRPLAGIEPRRWEKLVDDAQWLLAEHGENAARCGWSTADLFGLWPDNAHWGGVADRLRGSRSLLMDDLEATWRRPLTGDMERFNKGSYPDLRAFWEL
jgi:hypothetical protein